MDVSDILSLSRDQTHVNDTQYPDAQVLKYLNIVKNNFWSYIVTALNEDYDWDIFLTDTVANQSEYVMPLMASDTAWAKKLKWLSINYDGETYDDWSIKYIKAKETKLSSLTREWNYYVNNQDQAFPIYYIADNSVFIAPAPTSAITSALQLKGIKKIPDYTVDTVEANMVIPIDHHDILIQGVLPYILKSQGKNSESIAEKQEYIRQRDQSTIELADRNLSPLLLDYPFIRESNSDQDTLLINLN